ncbi:DNA ligase [Ottowia sp.]|uniref:DNA ligase n=1 Tax=Ottowia sp. TaxID=1898956 RepID=UPI0039E62584
MFSVVNEPRRAWLRAALSLLVAAPALAQTAPPLLLAGRHRPGTDLRDWWVSEKYDGVRGYWDGRTLRTRGGEAIAAPAWFTAGWPAEPMDGELWAGRGRFAQAQSAVARQQPDDAAWRGLRYMVFDLPAHAGSFDERLSALNGLVARIDRPWVQAVPQRKVGSDAELQALLRQVVRGGGEGLMLHRGASLYRAGRGDDLLKLKDHDDAEARVIAHLPGKGRHAGRLGALLVETPEGRRFALGTGFSDAQRRNPPPVGSWVTYRYRGLHEGSGLPRFASFMRVRAT